MRVAVVTSARAHELSADDPILLAALEGAGHQAEHWRWDDPTVSWSGVDLALVRSTWDYFERIDEFRAWLQATRNQVRFANPAEILEWNLDKHYLVELANKGLPVVPTEIADREHLQGAVERIWARAESAIIKPAVSGGSWGLHHVQPGDAIEVDPRRAPWLVQPFVPSIVERGELSVILLGGKVSHGIRKVPSPGDIRVQKEFGGRYEVETPNQEVSQVAHQLLQACPGPTSYARADFVERAGRLELMELELLEPELFLALVPEAADRLVAVLGEH